MTCQNYKIGDHIVDLSIYGCIGCNSAKKFEYDDALKKATNQWCYSCCGGSCWWVENRIISCRYREDGN